MIDRKALGMAYFTRAKIAKHQIESFDKFIKYGLQKVIDEEGKIETDIEDTKDGRKFKIYVRLGKIWVGKPIVHEADGTCTDLYPRDARLRNLTYAAPIHLQTQVVHAYEDGKEEVARTEEVIIGELPIMVKSCACRLHGLSDRELFEKGEDPEDPGGYFIINGTERALMTLEDLAPNKILVEYEERYGEKIEIAKVTSQRRGYRAPVTVEFGKDGILEVTFPSMHGKIDLVTLLRALGLETDEEIIRAVSDNRKIVEIMEENVRRSEFVNKEEAIMKVGRKVAGGQTREYQRRRAEDVLNRHLLPHLGVEDADRIKKAYFLADMAEACLELHFGLRREDDKDHYANKRLKLAGDLMEDLFRVAFNRLAKDIKYQLERSYVRHRELRVATAVRSDVLTDRLLHPLATGNWVGGRTGVSQLLDRSSYLSTLSHLRRVISPLSRTQPHFEARDLHPTQFGRICPTETPEGPNCGLVKNLSQMAELSTGTDREVVKNILFQMGVRKLER